MKSSTVNIKLFIFIIFLPVICTRAQHFDFILYNGNQSYLYSLSNQPEKIYIGKYMSLYKANMINLYTGWANTFMVVGANLPPFGKPPSVSYAGMCLGAGLQVDVNWNDVGYRTHDLEGEGMFDMSFFVTLPSGKLFEIDSLGILGNTDITLKFNSIILTITDARMHFSNIGLLIRKKMLSEFSLLGDIVKFSGASISFGILYSTSSAREDDILNSFENDIPDSHEPPEVTVVDKSTGGTITMGAPVNPNIPSFVFFPYVEFQHLSLQTGVKGYLNIYNFLDVFIGGNMVIAPLNKIYADVYSNVNIRITDNQGLDSNYDGKMTIRGTVKGDNFIPIWMLGAQFNFGPVKLPIQTSASPTTDTISINVGLYVSF